MTNAEVMAQILSEVSGQPKEEIGDMIDAALTAFGRGRANMDVELRDEEAQDLLDRLRKEKPGIALWLVKAGLMANPGNIQGSA